MFASMRSVMFLPLGTYDKYLLTGSSRLTTFLSASCKSAVTVNVFVMLPTRKCSSPVIGVRFAASEKPLAVTYVPSGIQIPTTTPGALKSASHDVTVASSFACVSAGNDAVLGADVAAELEEPEPHPLRAKPASTSGAARFRMNDGIALSLTIRDARMLARRRAGTFTAERSAHGNQCTQSNPRPRHRRSQR